MTMRNSQLVEKASVLLAKSLQDTPLVRRPIVDFKARNHLVRTDIQTTGYTWEATGEDPQFWLTRHLPLPGWQMLEVAMEHDQATVSVKLYLDTGTGFSEAQSVYLPLKSGRISKRLFYVPRKLKALRFDPMDTEGCFSLTHLRIAWLTPMFAHDRLAQRLANMHHAYRGVAKGEVLPELRRQARRALA
jgi:hypothetical protein